VTEMTVADRLGIRPGVSLWFMPIEWLRVLGPLPPGVRMTGEFAAAAIAVIFVSNAGSIRWFLDRYRTVMTLPSAVWICSPAHGRPDFTRTTFLTILAGHGLHPLGETPIDGYWTAMRVGRSVPGTRPPAGRR